MSHDNVAFVLPPNLSKEVKRIQKEMQLSSPGKVIVKALALLQLSMGRKVKLEEKKKELTIKDFESFNQTVTFDDDE